MTTPNPDIINDPKKLKKFVEDPSSGLSAEEIQQILEADNPMRKDPSNPFTVARKRREDMDM